MNLGRRVDFADAVTQFRGDLHGQVTQGSASHPYRTRPSR
jgi:hypothetical protein